MKRLALGFGLGCVLVVVAGPRAAGGGPDERGPGVRRLVPVKRPDSQTRLEVLRIVRAAGSRDHKVRARAFQAWYGRRRENVYLPLVTGLTFSAARSRSFSAWALGELRMPNAIEPLSRRALLDESPTVRRTAVDSIRKIAAGGRVEALRPFLRALRSRRDPLPIRAARALGDLGDRRAVPALISAFELVGGPSARVNLFAGRQVSYIGGYDVEVAQSAAIAKPRVRLAVAGSVLDARILRTQRRMRLLRRVIVRSLEKLTGQRLGEDVRAWRRWYRTRSTPAPAATPGGHPARG